jgi:hypothetical protein
VFTNTGFSVLNILLGSKSGTAYFLALCKGHVDRRVLGVRFSFKFTTSAAEVAHRSQL